MYRSTNYYHNSIVLYEMVGPKYYCCVQQFLSHICSYIFLFFYFALLISFTIFNLFILLLFYSSSVYKSNCLHYLVITLSLHRYITLSCHSTFHLYVPSSFKMFCLPLFWLEHLHYPLYQSNLFYTVYFILYLYLFMYSPHFESI